MAEDLIKKADGTNFGTTMAGNFIHDIIDEDIKNQKTLDTLKKENKEAKAEK